MMRVLCFPFAIALLSACSEDEPGSEPGGEGEGEGEIEGEVMELLGEPVSVDVDAILSVGMALTVRSDGRAGFVFVAPGTGSVECAIVNGTVTAETVAIVVVDELFDGTFRSRTIAEVPPVPAAGIDIAVDPTSDALVVAFMGGPPAAGRCEASDLIMAVESGDAFILTTVAENGSDGSGPCRSEDPAADPLCDKGDFVGSFPALSIANGVLALAYTDKHFGFSDTDVFKSDLELARGTSPSAIDVITSINVEAGGGNRTSTAITDDGRIVIGHAIIGTAFEEEGVYAEVEQADGSFKERLLFGNAEVTSRIAVATAAGQGIYVVFREDGTDQLVVMRSIDDGESYLPDQAERVSVTGFSPQAAFLSDDTLVLAYGHCRDVENDNAACDTSQDGVRIAWRVPAATQFSKQTFTGDDEDLDGLAVDMAIVDDVITTLSFNASQSQATIHRMHKVSR